MAKNCKPNIIVPDKYSVVVVQNITERNDISCKLRQNGMIAIVVEEGYAQYQIQTQEGIYSVCNNNAWVQIETGDKVFDGNNLIILNDETHKQEYLQSELAVKGQMIFFVPEQKYYTYNGIGLGDPFPNKLDKPLDLTIDPDNKLIPVYGQSGDNPEWLPSNTLGKVESVNNVGVSPGTKNIELNLSNIPDDVGYATDAELTQLSGALDARITQVEGINYTWNPTNRTLTLFDTSGRQMSQVSLVSLDNEGTEFRYNAANKSLELYNADNQLLDSIPVFDFVGNVGTALQLNSNVLQLKDSQGNILSSVSFDVSNISGLQSLLDSKLDKTTTTVAAPDATFKYVYLTDESNNVRRMLAGDLGKNIANSSLTSVAGAGLKLGSSWTLNTNGQLYSVTNLPDKSADASFNRMMVQNSTGQVAWGNGNTLIKNMPSLLSDAEKTNWKTEMNGGWTTGTMSVATLFPNVVNNTNNNAIFITILGANLSLNPALAVISLINITNNSETIIPNSQVTYGDSGKITFWFRPSIVNNSGTAEYAIKLFNGVAQLVTSGLNNIIITDTVNSVDLSALTWDKVTYKQSEADNVIITSGGSVGIKNTTANTDGSSAQNLDYIGSAQSNVIANAGENFSLRGYLILQNISIYRIIQGSIGLVSSAASNTLLMNMLTSLKMYSDGGNWVKVNKSLNEQSQTGVYSTPELVNVRVDFVINKRDNNVSFSASHNNTYNGTTLVSNTVSKTIADSVNIALSVKGSKGNNPELGIIGVFEEMYKF